MSGQGTVKVHIVGRIQSLFGQPGKQPPLYVTIGKKENYTPILHLEPEAPKNQTWCLIQTGTDAQFATNGCHICSYPDLSQYLRLSEHDINPLDSEAFCHIEAIELPSPLIDGASLPDLGHRARFSVQLARSAASGDKAGYSIRALNNRSAVLQAGTREAEPWPGMTVCAHSQKGESRELWLLEKSVAD